MEGKRQNPHIPKYISTVPWYFISDNSNGKPDYLQHHRKKQKKSDHDGPEEFGINDSYEFRNNIKIRLAEDYDSKRDTWFGFNSDDWTQIAKNWKYRKPIRNNFGINDDSDDTDYGLEMMELGLNSGDFSQSSKDISHNISVRDRGDVPNYVKKISLSEKLDYQKMPEIVNDPSMGFVNDSDVFTKVSGSLHESGKEQHMTRLVWDTKGKKKSNVSSDEVTEPERHEFTRHREDIPLFDTQTRQITEVKPVAMSEQENVVANTENNINANKEVGASHLQYANPSSQSSHDNGKAKTHDTKDNSSAESTHKNSRNIPTKYTKGGDLQDKDLNTDSKIDYSEEQNTIANLNQEKKACIIESSSVRVSMGSTSSKFKEDIYNNGHTSVWGSYFQDGSWGYACCKSLKKASSCQR